VNEFGRMNGSGLHAIRNVNLIYAGETLYHISTHNKSKSSAVPPSQQPKDWLTLVNEINAGLPARNGTTPSDAEKKKITKETLAHDFDLKGEQLELLEHVIDIVHVGMTALELLEIATFIGEWGAVTSGAVNVVVLPLLSAIEIVSAFQSGERLAGLTAVAYTTTAWAFGDPIPAFPETRKAALRANGLAKDIAGREKAWQESSHATVRSLNDTVAKKRISKKTLQVVLRAVGNDDRQTLCRILLKELAKDVRMTVEKNALLNSEYPN
jgi:hypothetical protein